MIIIKVIGGYGNQLFNYALAKSFQNRGRRVRLDWSFYDVQGQANDFRIPIKNYIGIDIKEASRLEIFYCELVNKLKREPNLIVENYDNPLDVYELLKLDNKILVGYWQNKELFNNIKDDVSGYFRREFEKNLNGYSAEILNEINSITESVAIHVRGGDYLKDENKITFGNICDKLYYENAIKLIIEDRNINMLDVKIFVFTNDVEYASLVLPEQYTYNYVNNSENDGYMDVYLMSKCKNLIIANSTFSWWGAYISDNDEKLVVMPKKWKNRYVRDSMECDGWKAI